jgi:hypothetical protein
MELNTVDSSHTLKLTVSKSDIIDFIKEILFSHFEKSIYPSTFGPLF